MTAETVTTAVARQETRPQTPGAMVKAYSQDFANVLPSHIKPVTWVRLAQGALKKGKRYKENGRDTDRTELEVAASNNPGVFLAALLDAARLGLDPGTEQYYLTPRRVKGKLEILGIVGYQGYVELMYRAGAISSIVAEVVHTNDSFRYQPGRMDRPEHEIDWDADDRGDRRLVYSYAVMKDGATSRVVVLNRADIDRIKKSATAADSEYSPWQTNPEAMWLKSAVRQLAKWVPTSAEYVREMLRAQRDVAAEDAPGMATPTIPGGEIERDADVVDAELVDEPPVEQRQDAEPPADAEPDRASQANTSPSATRAQLTRIHTALSDCGVSDRTERLTTLALIAGRDGLESSSDLTKYEASRIIDAFGPILKADDKATALSYYLANIDDQGGQA